MLEAIKQKIVSITEIAHLRIFGHEMSDEMRKFLGHLSWSFLGGGIASGVMLAINILAGKLIGPEGYGKYSLALTISQLATLPIIFGMDFASIKIIAQEKDKNNKSKYISSAFYFVLVMLILAAIIFAFLNKFVINNLTIDKTIVISAWIFTIVLSIKAITDVFFRGLCLFKEQFIGRMGEVAIASSFFIITFIFLKKNDYQYYVASIIAGSLFLIVYYLNSIRPSLAEFKLNFLKKLVSFGKFIFIGSIFGTIFTSADKFIIARYLNISQLGIYSAYITASSNLVAQLIQMFINPFLPAAAKSGSFAFIRKINKIFLLGFVPCFIAISIFIMLVIKLFGSSFNFNLRYVAAFGFLSTLQAISIINFIIIIAISEKLYRKYVFYVNSLNFINSFAYFVLIYLNSVTILYIVAILIANNLATILLQKIIITKHLNSRNE